MILALLFQITPVVPIPKGSGLPPTAATDVPAVLAAAQRLVAALETADAAGVLATTRAEGGAATAVEQADGGRTFRYRRWAEFAAAQKPDGARYSEANTDPAIEVDGDIAMMWSPYVVRHNGAVAFCGYNHFDLVREGATWKVLNLTWTRRTTGCGT